MGTPHQAKLNGAVRLMRTQRMNSTQREMRTPIEIESNDEIKESHKENGKGEGKEQEKVAK